MCNKSVADHDFDNILVQIWKNLYRWELPSHDCTDSYSIENILTKGEIAHDEQFLILSQLFQMSSAGGNLSIHTKKMITPESSLSV